MEDSPPEGSPATQTTGRPSVWDRVVGQPRAVRQLIASAVSPVHAYLFVGPAGSTKDEAARAFAALLLARTDDPDDRDARLALVDEHPDVRLTQRQGPRISAPQIDEVIRIASLLPMESDRKVMILDEFHLLEATQAARLLKVIEEPPASTFFIVLADQVPDDLVTIASRCVRIDFSPIDADVIARRLIDEGCEPDHARSAAAAAAGSLDRARVLVSDEDLARRRDSFASVPRRLDGTGTRVATLAEEIVGLADASAAPLVPIHAAEVAALEARVAVAGERGSGRKALEEKHKREVRRHRTDELRSGLGVIAGVYRDALVAGSAPRPDRLIHAVHRVHEALEALERNPNESLLLQALLLDLPGLST
jgi:DNA polymerase III subunit delta'